jgi:hypothetical protein
MKQSLKQHIKRVDADARFDGGVQARITVVFAARPGHTLNEIEADVSEYAIESGGTFAHDDNELSVSFDYAEIGEIATLNLWEW